MLGSRYAAAIAALLFFAPAAASAQTAREGRDVLVRVNGAAHVAAGDTVSVVVSVGDSAHIEGVVTDQLVVVHGAAFVSGAIEGDVVVVGARLELAPGARIDGKVRLVDSHFASAPDAFVGGTVEEARGFGIPAAVLWTTYLGVSVIVLALGALLALLAGRQISEAARIAVSRPGPTALATLIPLALPALGVAAMMTVIGIPLGVLIFALLMPALWLGGYVVAGAAIGGRLLGRRRRPERLEGSERLDRLEGSERPYGAVLLGLLILQLLWLLPIVGGAVAFLAGLWGAGALIYRGWESRRPGEPPAHEEEWRRAA